jgi:N-acyl-D-amino-acid deacylase
MKADVAVFDRSKVGDKAEFERSHQYSVGVRDAVVNGK